VYSVQVLFVVLVTVCICSHLPDWAVL